MRKIIFVINLLYNIYIYNLGFGDIYEHDLVFGEIYIRGGGILAENTSGNDLPMIDIRDNYNKRLLTSLSASMKIKRGLIE
jgi:hypothetical protein